jgi:hypothetical protein
MSWSPSDVEIASVTRLKGRDRYAHFVKKVADQEELWSLWDDGWALAKGDDARELIPVWPHAKYAVACATGSWKGSVPKPIALEAWMQRWTPGAIRDGRLIAVFPTPENTGIMVEAGQLAADIEAELESYE